MDIKASLDKLRATGNFRQIPSVEAAGKSLIDLSSNDYLGIAADSELYREFAQTVLPELLARGNGADMMTSSASRLLAARQECYAAFETLLAECYSRRALLFNSGYHANTGIIGAMTDHRTLIVADKLVHASIIDGIKLSGAPFERFRHNDYTHLERILAAKAHQYDNTLIIAESVYSMDGDTADIRRLVDIKRHTPGAILYIDEAHGVGVAGPHGLGLVQASGVANDVDIVIGTLGKALASIGAYAIVSDLLRDFLINRARSFIFSTSLPPINVAWSRFVFSKMLSMDSARSHLRALAEALAKAIGSPVVSHIQPLIVGDPALAVKLSASLLQVGYKVLPIRTPTVPPGTDRLRFSLSAALQLKDIEPLHNILDANAV